MEEREMIEEEREAKELLEREGGNGMIRRQSSSAHKSSRGN